MSYWLSVNRKISFRKLLHFAAIYSQLCVRRKDEGYTHTCISYFNFFHFCIDTGERCMRIFSVLHHRRFCGKVSVHIKSGGQRCNSHVQAARFYFGMYILLNNYIYNLICCPSLPFTFLAFFYKRRPSTRGV